MLSRTAVRNGVRDKNAMLRAMRGAPHWRPASRSLAREIRPKLEFGVIYVKKN